MYKRFVLLSVFLLSSALAIGGEIKIECFRGDHIRPYTDKIIPFVDRIYRESPYFYNGDDEGYQAYLETYATTTDGMICLAFDEKTIIGIAAGMPMGKTRDIYQKPFLDHGHPLGSFYYLGEFGLRPDYHGKGIEEEMLKKMEAFVVKEGKYKNCCLWEIQGPSPSSAKRYIPKNDFWTKNGFSRHSELNFLIYWTNIDEKKESPHLAVYWIKEMAH